MAPSKSRKVAIVGSRSVGTSFFLRMSNHLSFALFCFQPSIFRLVAQRNCKGHTTTPACFHMSTWSCAPGFTDIFTYPRCNPGKSSLAVQFVENHFVESYYPTIENTFSTVIKYKGQDFSTEIVDTAGQVSSKPLLCLGCYATTMQLLQ